METYRLKIREILKELTGQEDVSFVDYKSIDENTIRSGLDFQKVRGSVRLTCAENVLLPSETEAIVKKFINTKPA